MHTYIYIIYIYIYYDIYYILYIIYYILYIIYYILYIIYHISYIIYFILYKYIQVTYIPYIYIHIQYISFISPYRSTIPKCITYYFYYSNLQLGCHQSCSIYIYTIIYIYMCCMTIGTRWCPFFGSYIAGRYAFRGEFPKIQVPFTSTLH